MLDELARLLKCRSVKSHMSKKPAKRRLRASTLEALENRQLLTGQGIELPVASFATAADVVLQPTAQGQISRATLIDLDLDGNPDYATTISGTSSAVSFFLGDGEGYNKSESIAVSDNWFADIIHADINGDGYPDVIVAGQESVRTYLNQGLSAENTWLGMKPHEQLNLTASSLAAADLNADGKDDLVIATERRVDVRFSDSQSKFTSGVWYLSGPGNKYVTTGDVNRDGAVDIVASLSEDQTARVLLNDGEGFLAPTQTIPNVKPLRKLKLLDVDGDAILDLIGGGDNQEEANVLIWSGTESGTFSVDSAGYETIGRPYDFVVGDMNADGSLDLVVGHESTFHHPITNNGPGGVSVLLGTSPGSFHEPIRISASGAPHVAITQEVDGPRIRALRDYSNIVSQFSWQDIQSIEIARDYSDEVSNPFEFRTTAFGDFNADGAQDALVAELFVEDSGAKLFLAQPDGNYAETLLNLNTKGRIEELFTGDFNGDEIDDLGLIVRNGQLPAVVSLLSNGDGTFQSARTANLPESFSNFEIVDMNNDGRADLVGMEAVGINTWIVTGIADDNGVWTSSGERLLLKNRFVSELNILDLNGDNNLDVLATSFQSAEYAFGVATGGFGESSTLGLEHNYYAAGDFNGDGISDIAAANFGPVDLTIGYGQADGTFELRSGIELSEPLENTQGLQAIDIFNDGTAELVAFGNNTFHLLSATGMDSFAVSEYSVGFYPGRLFASEVTGDEHVDLVVAAPGAGFISSSPTASVAILTGTGDGEFQTPVISAASLIDAQLVSIQQQGDQLEFLLTHRYGFGKMLGSLSTGSLSGDFDGDGSIDSDDIDLLCSASRNTNLPPEEIARFDQNSDNRINADDVDSWLENVANSKRGDTDLDGDVDFADFLQLSAQFGSSDAAWSDGDFDCDGRVGFSDFLLLSQAFGK